MSPGKELRSFPLIDTTTVLVTRDQGERARTRLLQHLDQLDVVTIDIDSVGTLTPSFADEFLGPLLEQLGKREFMRRIVLKCSNSAWKALINKVLAHRLAGMRH